jgi:uncharacterized protein YceK
MRYFTLDMKSKLLMAMAFAVLLGCSGCFTSMTIERAKGQVYTDNKGVTNVVEEPAPELYALLPFTVALDVVTYPFFCIGGWVYIAITGHTPY